MGNTLRALIVEDSPDDLLLLTRELGRLGYELEFERVDTAEGMRSALQEKTWDIIFSDERMPAFNSMQALEVLRDSGLDLPFILISGTIGEEAAIAALKAGANDFVVKGKFARLGPAIERELREAASRRERRQAEQAFVQAREFAEKVIQTANVIFLQLDMAGNIVKINAAAEEISGYSMDELQGKSWFETLAPKQRYPYVWEEFVRITQRGEAPRIFENPILTKNGEERYVLWKNSILREGGDIVGTISFGVDITERKRAEEKIQRQLQRLSALRSIDIAISSSFDMNLSLTILLAGTVTQLEVDAASVLLFNKPMLTLEYAAGSGFNSSTIRQTRLRIGEGLTGKAAQEQRTVHVTNLKAARDGFLRAELLKEERFISYYAAPLIAKGELKGMLEVFQRAEIHPDQEWLDFLGTLAGQAAIAIDNAQLFESLERSNIELELAYDATIEGWSRAMDLRDKETEGHTLRVTDLTLRLADSLRVDRAAQVQIRRGALLHDMGKLGVPDAILHKPGKLTDEEWKVMREHPQFAYDMLHQIRYLVPALEIPYCHHEKWDGTGYPRGLRGEEIPLAARLFAVVDVWDAVTSDRPYRAAWSHAQALEYIREQSGKHFDPKIAEAFLRMLTGG